MEPALGGIDRRQHHTTDLVIPSKQPVRDGQDLAPSVTPQCRDRIEAPVKTRVAGLVIPRGGAYTGVRIRAKKASSLMKAAKGPGLQPVPRQQAAGAATRPRITATG
jgi:hypothetical protein